LGLENSTFSGDLVSEGTRADRVDVTAGALQDVVFRIRRKTARRRPRLKGAFFALRETPRLSFAPRTPMVDAEPEKERV
jgi:hypothetical protein